MIRNFGGHSAGAIFFVRFPKVSRRNEQRIPIHENTIPIYSKRLRRYFACLEMTIVHGMAQPRQEAGFFDGRVADPPAGGEAYSPTSSEAAPPRRGCNPREEVR